MGSETVWCRTRMSLTRHKGRISGTVNGRTVYATNCDDRYAHAASRERNESVQMCKRCERLNPPENEVRWVC